MAEKKKSLYPSSFTNLVLEGGASLQVLNACSLSHSASQTLASAYTSVDLDRSFLCHVPPQQEAFQMSADLPFSRQELMSVFGSYQQCCVDGVDSVTTDRGVVEP